MLDSAVVSVEPRVATPAPPPPVETVEISCQTDPLPETTTLPETGTSVIPLVLCITKITVKINVRNNTFIFE